jgi:hypothetical protein
MRWILHRVGYKRDQGDMVWRRGPDDPEFPDERVDEEHFRVLIESMAHEMWSRRAKLFSRKMEVSRHE